MIDTTARIEERVLILAPTGRDGHLIATILCQRDIEAEAVGSIAEFCAKIAEGGGAAIVTEEGLSGTALEALRTTLARQPAWSDIPIVILTTGGETAAAKTWNLVQRLEPSGNVSLLERPLRSITLVNAVQVALRSRRRQYEVRDLYETLEGRVAERTAELERLNREAEGFNYSISHDLRAPLRAIIATSQMLVQDYSAGLPEQAQYYLQRQSDAASRLAALIDDLLKLSRLSHTEMRPVSFNLSDLAQEVIDEMALNGPVKCTFQVQPDLNAFGDPFLVRFVLWNLLNNACKFSPEGGLVSVSQEQGGAFCVRDQGIGFDMRYVEKLFQPFERLVTESQFPGTGIGLANVKRIVERHGGRVWAESEPGCGSRFLFTLEASSKKPASVTGGRMGEPNATVLSPVE
ncbi:sensor histidine kinase [Fimbriimonas ginsengisoli]|uniref:histidine kinase n=1 Tax=Fimbriimonas ginsengisoli Gsoil 348 TaxID=661478 RepID=A0A068NM28_FIMGI|nr:ATP-binding protein [Fimbriimonas ginsengisoli]AIE83840.1 PAS/PAC sensor signal transduction histidine kinase [Fimbriimonas ginsengisoli Gsoil 348]